MMCSGKAVGWSPQTPLRPQGCSGNWPRDRSGPLLLIVMYHHQPPPKRISIEQSSAATSIMVIASLERLVAAEGLLHPKVAKMLLATCTEQLPTEKLPPLRSRRAPKLPNRLPNKCGTVALGAKHRPQTKSTTWATSWPSPEVVQNCREVVQECRSVACPGSQVWAEQHWQCEATLWPLRAKLGQHSVEFGRLQSTWAEY